MPTPFVNERKYDVIVDVFRWVGGMLLSVCLSLFGLAAMLENYDSY